MEQKKDVDRYIRHCRAAGKSQHRIAIIENAFKWLDAHAQKEYKDMCRDDVDVLFSELEDSDYSDWTKYTFRVVFKTFFRWLRDDEYPKEIRSIKLKKPGEKLTRADMLEYEELLRIIKLMPPHWRACIHTMYDGNFRVGELLSTKVGGLNLKEDYAELSYPLNVGKTKTGSGTKVLTLSVPDLVDWMEIHPQKNNPDSPLFMTYYKWSHSWRPIQQAALLKTFKRYALKAGVKKRIYNHLCRHSRTTSMYDESYDTTTIERSGGWSKGSNIPRRYEHLSVADHKRKMLEKAGVAAAEEKVKLHPIRCPWCQTLNTAGRTRCKEPKCRRNLNPWKQAEEDRKFKERIMEMLKEKET